MSRQQRANILGGLLLILVGAWFLAVQYLPGLNVWVNMRVSWPLFVVGAGLLMFILGLFAGVPDMAVPASIIAGIGGLLYWQNATGNWASWAYAWALIPGFAGVGVLISGLLGAHSRQSLRDGINLIIISGIMFAIFSSFLGGPRWLGRYWPVLLILLGLWVLLRPIFRRR